MTRCVYALGITLLILTLASTGSGQNLIIKGSGEKDSLQSFSSNSEVAQVAREGRVLSSNSFNRNDRVNVIVELTAPASGLKKGKAGTYGTAAAQQQNVFAANVLSKFSSANISRRFSGIVDALSLSATREEVNEMSLMPGVKRIHDDRKVTASAIHTSAAQRISTAGSLASRATGKGIKVGVIDTGIDYLHKALGGGFGPGFKVAGGYDFINGSPKPLDDNGHGTHVAGIIAGSSDSIKSIAPDVQLFSYKVLDASGSGSTSTVIAAIEQAVTDGVDVINLSLGTSNGDPDDILSEAVDRAVEADVVVVVAAGNDGNGGDQGTISSPGAARQALTVGAAAGTVIASFSSQGPSLRLFGLKPDVVAPGESIVSAKMGGGYIAMSGTSMAAPYVSAIAADMRELHPEWSAREIRDGVIAATRDLHMPIFLQGKGIVDTSRILAMSSFISPASVSFGIDNPGASAFVRRDSVILKNTSTATRTFSAVHLPPHAGISALFSPSALTLPPGAAVTVAITLTVNNSLLSNNSVLTKGYEGKFLFISEDDTANIPYVFFKGAMFQIAFSETPVQVVIHDRKQKALYYTPSSPFLSAIVTPGLYDVMTAFSGSTYVVKENLNTADNPEITVARAEARNIIEVAPSDENGTALAPLPGTTYSYVQALMHTGSGLSEIILGGGKVQSSSLVQKIYCSDLSPSYSFGYAVNIQYGNTRSYTYDVELDTGIAASKSMGFTPSDLKHVEFKYEIGPGITKVFPITWSAFAQTYGVIAVTYYDGDSPPLLAPFIQTGYYSRRSSAKFPIYHFREAYKY